MCTRIRNSMCKLLCWIEYIGTIMCPRDEAAGAVSHVESSGGEREPLGCKDSNECRNSSFKSELNLRFMGISWCY